MKIPLKAIYQRQLLTYEPKNTNKKGWRICTMQIIPFFISVILCFNLGFKIPSNVVDTLVTVMSIFIPLLFTALISLHDTRQNLRVRMDMHKSDTTNIDYLLQKYEQLADNVSFILAVSIIELIVLLVMLFCPGSLVQNLSAFWSWFTKALVSTIVVYLLQIILFHIVFVIERLASLVKVSN